MSLPQKALSLYCSFDVSSLKPSPATLCCYNTNYPTQKVSSLRTPNIHMLNSQSLLSTTSSKLPRKMKPLSASLSVPQPLDLTEDNVKQALVDARGELGQIFDTSVGMT
ncbi:hypothetical protein L195_g059448, partial [Trifolium pratense]